MSRRLVPPTDPRESEALRKIDVSERAALQRARWSWAALVPRVMRTLGLLIFIWAFVGIAIAAITRQLSGATFVQAAWTALLGIGIVISATWGYRYAHARAFGNESRPGL